jgi:hypothetical protein
MILQLDYYHRKDLVFLSFLFLMSFLYAPFCSATINKSTAAIVVSTKDQNNWYDLSDKSLSQTFAVCDGTSTTDSSKYSFTTGCNSNGKHDDYLYTDTEDERNIYPTEKNFTIKASVSASSGSITKIKLEWIYGLDSVPSDSSWTNSANHPGSATCDNKGTCTFCVEGGSCDKPSIPQAALSVKSDGAQNRFHFRVTFMSSDGDSVISGYDDTLSKFHSFVICGPKCNSCADYAPTVVPESVTSPSNSCFGLNDTNGYYIVNWKNKDMPSGAKQTHYKLSVRKLGATSVKTKEETTSNTYAQVPSSWLEYGGAYEWQVTVKYEGQGCEWTATSPWSSSTMNISVMVRFPVPNIKVTNQDGADCLSGGCKEGDTLTFDGSGSSSFDLPPEDSSSGSTYSSYSYSYSCSASSSYSYSGPDGSYSSSSSSSSSLSFDWTLANGSGSQHFAYSETASSWEYEIGNVDEDHKYNTKLSVTDCAGHTCSIEIPIDLDPDSESCDDGPDKVSAKIVKPASLCSGLNDTDGYYAVSWNTEGMPSGARQIGYEITLKDKSGATPVQTIKREGDEGKKTMARILTSMIDYGKEYEVVVKTKIESADKKCTWDVESGKTTLLISKKYPEPGLTVKDGPTDCLLAVCETDKELTFDASSSKIYAGSATYDWDIDGDDHTGVSFKESFAEPKTRQVTLEVTDGDGNSCTVMKDLPMKNPDCVGNPTVSLGGVSEQGDYCDGMKSFRLSWTNNAPSDIKQESYEITAQNINDPSDKYVKSEASPSTTAWIPTDEINWNSEYSWQIKVTFVSANNKCRWENVLSPVSNGASNIKTPQAYPRPVINITNDKGTDCLFGECVEGEIFTFYGGNSVVAEPKTKTQYDWILDGNARSGVQFSEQLAGVSHEVTLSVTDDYNQTCTSDKEILTVNQESATNSQAGWVEIAPR